VRVAARGERFVSAGSGRKECARVGGKVCSVAVTFKGQAGRSKAGDHVDSVDDGMLGPLIPTLFTSYVTFTLKW
jgi:hypothetical protein